jgi:hypothetical protein
MLGRDLPTTAHKNGQSGACHCMVPGLNTESAPTMQNKPRDGIFKFLRGPGIDSARLGIDSGASLKVYKYGL